MSRPLDGRTILVTNVTHFVGPPSVPAFLAAGARLVCHDEGFADAERAAAFGAAHPDAIVAPEPLAEDCVAWAEAEVGPLDVVVSNDHFPAHRILVDAAGRDDFRAALEALAVTPFAVAGAAAKAMKPRRAGKIILVTSAAPLQGLANYSIYAAAREAANGLVKSLARELGKANIQVNALAPNFVESPSYFPEALLADEAAMAKITRQIPLGRLGKPEEAAAYLVFLASGQSDFITGQVLAFAGGWA
ncbi:SDR family oxidoreductase [Oceanibacterium hippocampi]|uniref:3-oxoacyl-[acyl-carrier-protein] reductase FabG n=1 Tax=Oceanibacterium hippocampi TaxID=745714 RepID=A0A1Y5S9R3_9PROT|nr:SDR family oxidoreductase [Oceanibacterium hippocampi]SLN35651.1 3-oxoacyl-[acyl-carrier-protein] reductase FabG [Oceanibacterium hippocampi]